MSPSIPTSNLDLYSDEVLAEPYEHYRLPRRGGVREPELTVSIRREMLPFERPTRRGQEAQANGKRSLRV